jgi:hypothetical protein
LDDTSFARSAALLKKWGNTKLPDRGTLSDRLMIGKVSLWTVAAPFLALYRFPEFVFNADFRGSRKKHFTETTRHARRVLGLAVNMFINERNQSAADCALWPTTSPRVLFPSLGPQFYRETFKSAAEHLADHNSTATVVLFSATKFRERSSRELIKFHSTTRYVTPKVAQQIAKHQNHIQNIRNEFLSELRHVVNEDSPELGPEVQREFKWLFRDLFPHFVREIAIAEHVLTEHKPDIVVSPDDAHSARIYTILAQKMNIPSLIIQQGVLDGKAVEWRFCTADHIAAMGPSSKAAMRAHNIDGEKIELTGCPRFDVLCRPSTEKRNKIRTAMHLRSDEQMILLASQPNFYGAFSSPEARREMLREIGKVTARMESVRLIVKAHPCEDIRELRRLIGNGAKGKVSFVESSCDIQDLILACDVFVTFFSTSALQALIAAKPVISLCFQGSGVTGPYANSEAVFQARSTDELADHLNILTGQDRSRVMAEREEARKKLTYDTSYLSDGYSAQRVAELVMRLIKGADH